MSSNARTQKNEFSSKERICVSADVNPTTLQNIEYTLPFNAKTLNSYTKKDRHHRQVLLVWLSNWKDQTKVLDR
jgi:hypothetical protein